MSRFRIDLRGGAFRSVLGFTWMHWQRQPARLTLIVVAFLAATMADVLTPLYAGRLVDAVASGSAADEVAWDAATAAFAMLIALALGALLFRYLGFMAIIDLTLKMMADVGADAFHRVQRFSTDWHANSFAGSTVRKITRGMWALDLLNDTILLMLLPSLVMLVGSTVLFSLAWPTMGLIVAVGSLAYIGLTVALSLGYVAPAARLGNAWDTKLGGALADAVSCNAVVKAFGAEAREDKRFAKVVAKWRSRTARTWTRGTVNGTTQGATLLLMRVAVIGFALFLWSSGQASAGDITFVLTSFFLLQGYLRDIGQHIRNLQRSVNDMEELVEMQAQPHGVADRPGAHAIRIGSGGIEFEDVTFHYGNHLTPLYRDFSVSIRAGERVGLVGHSGSGKTTFVKLIQRLYDVSEGRILIDGQDIAQAKQASLRSQIAIVQQEPILFHRSLAENIAYGRPGASQEEIEHAAKLASAHDFIVLMTGRTTLVIAHRLSTVKALDRLLVFDRGRIVEEGGHEVLVRKQNGIYRRLFERQALELTRGLA